MTPASKEEREVAEEIVLKNTKAVMADKGYDRVDFRKFIEEQGMIAIIPPRYMWKDKESHQYKDTSLYYNQDGEVFYRTEDIRIFSKVSQKSHKFERLYNQRSAIERINGRLDRDFMFENHTIRGLEKVTLYVSMACLCTLGFAYLKVKKQETEHLSSWVA